MPYAYGSNIFAQGVVGVAPQLVQLSITLNGANQQILRFPIWVVVRGNTSSSTITLPQSTLDGTTMKITNLASVAWTLQGANSTLIDGASTLTVPVGTDLELTYVLGSGWRSSAQVPPSAATESISAAALEQLNLQDAVVIGRYVTIAPGTGTITAALAAITDNAYNNWVCVYLPAGTYVDIVDLTSKPYVMLLGEYSGQGQWVSEIYSSSQAADTILQSGSKNILANLKVSHYVLSGQTYKYALHCDGSTISGIDYSSIYAFNCWFNSTSQTANESKSAAGLRAYANQEMWFESCKFTSNGMSAVYANNATIAQSAKCAFWFRNCTISNAGTLSTSYGFEYVNGGSTKQDTVSLSSVNISGGASATASLKVSNSGGAWETYFLVDPACVLGTQSIGSTVLLTSSLVPPRVPAANTKLAYLGSWYSGPSGAAVLSSGYLYGARVYMGVPGGTNIPYILANGQGYDFVDGLGNTRLTIQSNGVVAVPVNGYFDLGAGVQFTIRGPLVTTIQTIAAAGTVSGTGGYYIRLTGATATLSASGSTQTGQDFTLKNVSGGNCTLSANAGQSIIDLSGASVNSIVMSDGASIRLIFIGSNTWHQVV